MHAHLLLLTGVLLFAPQVQPRAEKLLAGPLGIAQQASLNQIDILLEMTRALPAGMVEQAGAAVSAAQRAHETAIRNLIVVERGTVTADYRRWKLRRAITALVRADRERDRVLRALAEQAPPEAAPVLAAAMDRARSESARAVVALRSLDGGASYGGAGGGALSEGQQWHADKARENRTTKDRAMSPSSPGPMGSCR